MFMALMDPPVETLITKAGSKYGLCIGISKRAKELITQNPEAFADAKIKPLEVASREFYQGVFTISK